MMAGNPACLHASTFNAIFFLSFQLNSPNRILLLHLSIVCLSLSVLYLWILINNSITDSPLNPFSAPTIPESAAITTATSSAVLRTDRFLDVTTQSPLSERHDSSCTFNDMLIHLLQPIGLWTISCINFDRYYAICSPLHYNTLFTTKKVNVSCWGFGMNILSPGFDFETNDVRKCLGVRKTTDYVRKTFWWGFRRQSRKESREKQSREATDCLSIMKKLLVLISEKIVSAGTFE